MSRGVLTPEVNTAFLDQLHVDSRSRSRFSVAGSAPGALGRARAFLLVTMVLLTATCATSPLRKEPVNISRIPDGVYAGSASSWPNKAEVRVTVREGRMTDIALVRHRASWIGRKAETVIPMRIMEKQSTDVDAVTGATNSSRVIMHAVYDALEQAVRKSVEAP